MHENRQTAALTPAVIEAWADDALPVLRTRTPARSFARRASNEHVVIVTATGVRLLNWPLAAVRRPRNRERRDRGSSSCACPTARRTRPSRRPDRLDTSSA